jgi:hypothetical protein
MNPSTFPPLAGCDTKTAISLPIAIGTSEGNLIGSLVSSWTGLRNSTGSHSAHWVISFATSDTNSKNMHHVGGLGEPPNVSRSDMNAVSTFTNTVCAAALALCEL